MNWTSCIRNWGGFAALCQKFTAAGIILIALFSTSCRTAKQSLTETKSESQIDSLVSEVRLLKTIPVPEAKVDLTVPIQSILDLPTGASFVEKNGRANVSVRQDNDTIYITASCDSLQALVEYYERELTRIRADTSVSKTESKKEVLTGIQSPFNLFSIGFIAGVVITIIISIKIKK
jgi:hypothetical protein